jgi:putative transposase
MAVKASQFDSKLIDELLKDCKTSEDILGQAGLVKQLTKALIERSLNAELSTHLGYEKHGQSADSSGNARNGYTPKTLKGEQGNMELDIPRDRDGSFSPKLVPKHL